MARCASTCTATKARSADLLASSDRRSDASRLSHRHALGNRFGHQQFLRSSARRQQLLCEAVLALDPAVYYRMEPTGDGLQLARFLRQRRRRHDSLWTGDDAGLDCGARSAPRSAWADRHKQRMQRQVSILRRTATRLSVVAWVYARSRPRWASIAKNWAGGNERPRAVSLRTVSRWRRTRSTHCRWRRPRSRRSRQAPASAECLASRRLCRRWQRIATLPQWSRGRLKPYHKLHRDPRIKALAIGTKLNLAGDAAGRT